jgi:hypothetical protein
MPGRQQLQQTRQNLHHTAQEALHDRDDARNSPTHGSGSQPNLMTLPAKWTLAFVAALLLLLLLGLMSYRRLKQEDAAQRWVSHTHKVMEQLDLALATSLELDAKQGADGNANPQLSPRTVEKLGANLSSIKTRIRARNSCASRSLTFDLQRTCRRSWTPFIKKMLPLKIPARGGIAKSRARLSMFRFALTP